MSPAVIAPFSPDNCVPISADKTLQAVKFRFHLRNGRLYAFWVSPDASGASHGYVAAGGPGFTGPADTVGAAAYAE